MTNYPKQDKDAGLGSRNSGGRFIAVYDPDIAMQIIEKVAEGQTIREICTSENGFPHKGTFYRWIADRADVARAYHAARELSAQSFEEEALMLAREIKDNPGSPSRVRAFEVAMNQLRWSATRRDPTKYGERAQVSVKVPVQINTTIDLGNGDTGSNTQEHPNIWKLETKVATDPDTIETPLLPPPRTVGGSHNQRKGPQKLVLTPRNPNWKKP